MIRRLLPALALGGCCTLVDNATFTVSGEVPPNAESCHVFLRAPDYTEVPGSRRKVAGKFQTDYPVTTCSGDYQIFVACEGVERRIAAAPCGTVVEPRG